MVFWHYILDPILTQTEVLWFWGCKSKSSDDDEESEYWLLLMKRNSDEGSSIFLFFFILLFLTFLFLLPYKIPVFTCIACDESQILDTTVDSSSVEEEI